MAKVNSSMHLDVPVEKMWELIGKFNGLPNWHPAGASESDAVKVIQGIYQAGFDNLKKMFGG